ncbi:glutamine--tRNA ligase [Quercus suber]|uniref:glutamine--tRNA ligase n=1 Tax=Quercus suber TaxID=58331 RepID=UPI0032DF8B84
MPGKEDSSSDKEQCLDLFLKIGLDERTAKNTIANNKVTANLTAVIHEAGVTDGCSRTVGNLIYTVATKYPANALVHRPTLLQYVVSSKIKTTAQLDAALSFFGTTASEDFKLNEFEEACGVGVEVSVEEIEQAVNEVFEENKNVILEQRYRTNVGELLGHVRRRHPWGDPKIVKFGTIRYDDTNPLAEKKEYIDHIEEIVQWMGWEPLKITYTSDYFQDLYDLAVELIRRGHAYVDHQTPDEIKESREKKMNSPWRDRPVSESLKLFEDMRKGLIEEGKATLRMKQDMQSDNYNMYDLIAYRIKFTPHPHAGDKWCIYPSYDYAHCIVDSIENITHSLCTLEFETRRASYYWLLHALGLYQPHVWEYSRLNVTNTVMSKRKLNRLVTDKWVDGWDDPRLMTLAGLRRRGVTPTAINAFVRGVGITRSDNSIINLDRLEYHIREELNKAAPRTMVVLHPLKVVITNLEADSIINLDAKRWPDAQTDDASAFYKVPFSNIIYIENSDFRMKDSKDYYGLAPGKSVLLRYAFPIKCTEVILADDKETILEIRAEYDPSKKTKPKGVLHWVAAPSPGVDPLMVEVRLFDKLFLSENPAELDDWLADLNPQSKVVIPGAYATSLLQNAAVGDKFQFERLGYFVVDRDSTPGKLIFNRTVTLRDSYSKGGK